MINKKRFILTVAISAVLCLLICVCSANFIFSFKENKNLVSPVLEITNNDEHHSHLGQSHVGCYYIDWECGKEKLSYAKEIVNLSNVQALSTITEPYTIVDSNKPSTIEGGTTVTLTREMVDSCGTTNCSKEHYVLTFTKNGESKGTIVYHLHHGYQMDGFQFGEVEGNYTSINKDFSSFSKTTEEIDPDYSGTLKFEATTSAIEYGLDLFYRNNGGTYSQIASGANNDLKYTVANYVELPSAPTTPNDAVSFKGWLFNLTVTESIAYKQFYNINAETNKITVTGTGLQLEFTTSSDGTNINGDRWYYVTDVVGYGNFTQNSSNPIIVADWTNKYVMDLSVGTSIWASYNFSNGVTKGDLCGAYAFDENSIPNKLDIANTDNYKYVFMDDQMNEDHSVFKMNADFIGGENSVEQGENYYNIFNYGHRITEYEVKVGDQWLTLNSDGVFGLSSSSGKIDVSKTNGNTTFNKIAELLDTRFQGIKDLPEITLTPAWEAQEFSVTSNSGSTNVTIATEYSLHNSESKGQTLVAYESGGYTIALDGVWDYVKSGISSIYDYKSGYVVNVEPQFLNNIYKVKISNIHAVATDTRKVSNGEFYPSANGYTENVYTFKDFASECVFKTYAEYTETKNTIDDYITYLTTFITNWENKKSVSTHADALKLLKYVHYENGTVSTTDSQNDTLTASTPNLYVYLTNGQTIANKLPSFEFGYHNLILWKNNKSNYVYKAKNYQDIFTTEISGNNYTEYATWELKHDTSYTTPVQLNAYYVYRLDLFHENRNGAYSTTKSNWYGTYTRSEVGSTIDVSVLPNGYEFKDWMFNSTIAKNVGWTVGDLDTSKAGSESVGTITISKGSTNLTMTVSAKNAFHNDMFYISHLQGTGAVSQLYRQSTENGNTVGPLITAKLSKIYNLKIDNTETYWKDKNSELFGAYSKTGSNAETGGTTTTMKVAATDAYEYPFMSSEAIVNGEQTGLAFYKKSDYTGDAVAKVDADNYYYVFNYGHRISGWRLYLEGNNYFVVTKNGNDLVWNLTEATNLANAKTDIELLRDATFADLSNFAEYADEYFAYKMGATTLTLYPVWDAVDVKMFRDGTSNQVVSTKFGSKYSANVGVSELGKSIACYTVGDQLIATAAGTNGMAGVWNYQNITHDTYQYDGNHKYSLKGTPVLLDDIYKVNLGNNGDVKIFATNTYQLNDGCEYSFNATSGGLGSRLTFANAFEGNTFTAFAGETLIDEYVTNLQTYLVDWNNHIDGSGNDDFSLFEKVFYTSGTRTADDKILTVAQGVVPDFYIYLANAQKAGYMPIFDKNYYEMIFWYNSKDHGHEDDTCLDSCVGAGTYAYKTKNYVGDIHADAISNYVYRQDENLYEISWYLIDGYTQNGNEIVVTLNPYYFRKYYNVSVETLFEEELARKGYVYIDIFDTVYEIDKTIKNTGGQFIAIYENNAMRIYNNAQNSLVNSSNQFIYQTEEVENFRLYEGCDISVTVKDQSQDVQAMKSALCDEMIGFKFDKNTSLVQTVDGSNVSNFLVKDSDYVFKNNAEDIIALGYRCGAVINLTTNFEKILYSMNTTLHKHAGDIYITSSIDGITTTPKVSELYEFSNMKVGDYYVVKYYAFAGFTLYTDAFILNDYHVLQEYADGDSQEYIITGNYGGSNLFDGTWLRLYYYTNNYDVNLTDIGTLAIQTEAINFNYGLKVYAPTDVNNLEELSLVETIDNSNHFELNYDTGTAMPVNVGGYIVLNEDDIWCYISSDGDEYALLSTRLFFPNNMTTVDGNFYHTYKFLLNAQPIIQTDNAIGSTVIAKMVEGYSEGQIISEEHRNIYMMFEVRKLLTISATVEKYDYDTNLTTRTTKITSGDNNFKTITNIPTSPVVIYSYMGCDNILSSAYNDCYYTGVEYYVDGAELISNYFVADQNAELVVKYVPKALKVEIVYSPEALKSAISDNFVDIQDVEFYLDDQIRYQLEVVNEIYDVNVEIGGAWTSSSNEIRNLVLNHTVSVADYNAEAIRIYVDIFEKGNSQIQVSYKLQDVNEMLGDDDYGTFAIYDGNDQELVADANGKYTIYSGSNVNAKLNLNYGYKYVGVSFANQDMQQQPIEDSKVNLITDFDHTLNAGTYYIVIDKIEVNAHLYVAEDQTAKYSFSGTDATMLKDLFVGKTIEFTNEDVNEERLDHFFVYKDANANLKFDDGEEVLQEINNDKNSDDYNKFVITSDFLLNLNSFVVNFAVKSVDRFRFIYTIEGYEYLKEDSLNVTHKTTGDKYDFGIYCDEGTELNVVAETIQEGKYTINFNSEDFDKLDATLVLDQDYNLTIKISPKIYGVVVDEYVYKTLDQVVNSNPEVEDEHVNGITESSKQQIYNRTATIEFNRVVANDRQLSSIRLSGNDIAETIIIDLNGETIGKPYIIVVNDDGVEEKQEVKLSDYGFVLSANNGKVSLTYKTSNELNIRLDYKQYKVIDS